MSKYVIGDKFEVNGIDCEVKFVNNDLAWLFPLVDEISIIGKSNLVCCACAKVDSKGFDAATGNRAFPIVNRASQAV